jgi:hypothetical protein
MEAAEIPAEVGVEAMETGTGETGAIGAFGAVGGEAAIAFTGVRSLPLVSAFRFTEFILDTGIIPTEVTRTGGTIPTEGTMARATIRTVKMANIILGVLFTKGALLARTPTPAL